MNIQELDSYNLADAVKFNDKLNPKIWAGNKMRPEVREKLLAIADDFREFLGVGDLELKDITVSGSNANYSYTPYSDIDLHLVVDLPQADANEVYRELFDAKKYQYNDQHDFKIGDYDVELYVENANKPPVSKGVYSVLNNDWINIPRKIRSSVDDDAVRSKYEDLKHRIETAVKSQDEESIRRLAEKIKALRQAGLDRHGELGPENLAYKMLRTQGYIQQLYDARNAAKDRALSLKERLRKKPGSVFTYGFKHEQAIPEVPVVEWEKELPSDEEILKDFVGFCSKELKLEHLPEVKLRKDPQWSVVNKTFGRYTDGNHMLEVAWGQRHIMDVLRTVAHELTHKHQHERDGSAMGPDAGETGSPWENEANARAGVLMRDYARLHPEYFAKGQAEELVGDEIKESASGYIPTKKQAKDPRFSMALTQDIRPGQLGKEANKLKLKTDSQGHPQLANPNGLFEQLMLEYQQAKETIQTPVSKDKDSEQYYKFIMAKHKLGRPLTRQEREFVQTHQMFKQRVAESEEQLDEVSMAPSRLKQFAQSDEAKGIMAGFEAELIFRDTTSDEDGDGDMEPDYDADERCRSIQQIVEFFEGGDYGYLSPRQRNALEENLDEQYYEWYDEQVYAAFRDEADDLVREIWLEERPMSERIHAALVDGLDLSDEEADRIQAVGDKAPKFTKSSDQEAYASENEDYETYIQAVELADEVLDDDVEQSISNQDKYYDSALDDFRDNFSLDDDSGFFDDVGLRWMSDVATEFDLDWPYMTGTGGNDGDRDWDSIGDSLHDAIGMQVKVSSGYHNATRKPDLWIVEPDSSLEPDDREDYGLEIVSPPMPLLQALEKLDQVVEWANGPGNAYTNESTGLHMGVSVPYKGGNVDYLKMLMFLGDEHVLEKFGRESNTYTRAAMKEIRSKAGSERNATAIMELLKNNLVELAERELVGGTGSGKYTSAHKQGKYIEFRSAGGDWLAKADEEIGVLENTMMRYAYAMYLGSRPDLERKEYAKKLYKLVANGTDDSTMALFSQYAAGTIDKEQLKKQWAEKTLAKDDPRSVAKNNWVVIDNNTGKTVPGQEYNGFTEQEVRDRAKAKLSPGSSDEGFDRAYSIHPKETGRWEVYRDDHGQEETLEIIDADRRGEAVDLAYDKYTGVIPFKVRAYYGDEKTGPAKELSPRAKLAKRIVQKPKQQADYSDPTASSDWEAVYTPTGRVVDTLTYADADQAETWRKMVIQQHDFPNPDTIVVRRAGEQTPNVAQNFTQSTNPNPTIQDANQVRASNGVPMWEIYQRDNDHVVHTFADHTQREAWSQAQAWLRGIGAEDLSVFSVRPKLLQAGEQNTPAQTPPTSGSREVPSEPGPNGEAPNYEVYMQRSPGSGALKKFYAATHPEAMAYLSTFRQTAPGAPSEYAIRNLPV